MGLAKDVHEKKKKEGDLSSKHLVQPALKKGQNAT